MPRIEVVPNNWENSQEKANGDGTPTIDICCDCREFFEEGQATPHYLQDRYPKSGVGSVDVAHPPYDDGFGPERDGVYACDCCGETLDQDKDG